jgi:hypothetical protein
MDDQSGPYTPQQVAPPADQTLMPHRGPVVLVLGIISIVSSLLGTVICCIGGIVGLICGTIAWVMGNRDLPQMDAGVMDQSGRGNTQAGRICGIIGVVLGILCLALALIMILLFAGAIIAGRAGGHPMFR